MNRHLVTIAAMVLAGTAVLTGSPARAGTGVGGISPVLSWGAAMEVPGTSTLNTGGNAVVMSVSCASAGDCAAGGLYTTSSGHQQAFVVSQVNGTWGAAIKVPGSSTLNTGGYAGVNSVSCASAGNCSASGFYTDGSAEQAFVVSQVNGTWGNAQEVPGIAALNTGEIASLNSVSCASAGNCSAGGFYYDSSSDQQAFVVSQVNGTWGTAVEVPGTASLNTGGIGDLESVSCVSAGNCSAGGFYSDSSGEHAFVVSQVNGTWGTAVEVPGTAGQLLSMSCASAGDCSAGGDYEYGNLGHQQSFVVSEVNGTWGTAEVVPGIATLNQGKFSQLYSVSCASAGDCSAGGFYYDSSSDQQAFVVSQVNGTWGKAKEVPGTAALNTGGSAVLESVSCASAGNCSAAGFYRDSSSHSQAFVVSQVNGTWGKAKEVPGTATLNTGGFASVYSVSCAPAGNCSAGGTYTDSSSRQQAFVVSKS